MNESLSYYLRLQLCDLKSMCCFKTDQAVWSWLRQGVACVRQPTNQPTTNVERYGTTPTVLINGT